MSVRYREGMPVWVHYKHPAEPLLMLAGASLGTSTHASGCAVGCTH